VTNTLSRTLKLIVLLLLGIGLTLSYFALFDHESLNKLIQLAGYKKLALLRRTSPNVLINNSETILMPISEPLEFDFLPKAEILSMREKKLNPYEGKLIGTYTPFSDVFGQMVDKAPWWGLKGIFFYGPGNMAISGDSEEARFILNPFLLVGVQENNALVTKTAPGWYENYYPKPNSLIIMKDLNFHVNYDISGYNDHLRRVNAQSELNTLYISAYNARDMGYNFLSFESNGSSNIRIAKFDIPIELIQFIHKGGSCGYKDGCNNMSPYQEEFKFIVEKTPAHLKVRLWKNEPNSHLDEADANYLISIY
jgi:hypothetical protein